MLEISIITTNERLLLTLLNWCLSLSYAYGISIRRSYDKQNWLRSYDKQNWLSFQLISAFAQRFLFHLWVLPLFFWYHILAGSHKWPICLALRIFHLLKGLSVRYILVQFILGLFRINTSHYETMINFLEVIPVMLQASW